VGLLFYEAALAVTAHVHARALRSGRPAEEAFQQFPSLANYAGELRRRMPEGIDWDTAAAWLRAEIDAWEAAGGALPLRMMETELGIERDARVLLVLLGLVEEDAAFASLFAALQAPPHRRPDRCCRTAQIAGRIHPTHGACAGRSWTPAWRAAQQRRPRSVGAARAAAGLDSGPGDRPGEPIPA
jgi:hypothetical protein